MNCLLVMKIKWSFNRYKHWCGRAERGRTRAPPCRRYSGGTSYGAGGPVIARRNWSPGPNLAADQLLRDSPTSTNGAFLYFCYTLLYYGLSLYLRSTALCHLGSKQVEEMLVLAVMPIMSIYQLPQVSMDTADMSSTSLRMSPHFPTLFLDYLPN